ncbi:protein-methionine-sulfoxide reductase catalytic subunit MsrP [Leisingera daeponensis]|uniref:protein-methionine-sulfoxide reductase catalytic subunit MsrP n=1 Tax=Leisingera daeponensis TaxID=405746 RepID=UPI001C94C6EF|nr:protein-methionine-sulfoxide reductase catalytic subunit MsrP [Leisingera daeponensis]MBY6057076.1 protein-methionine-sulfoxide reductase catalytic subunit MsrP [Leisingera daeponensis]
MARRWTNNLTLADATSEAAFWNRRRIMAGVAGTGLAAALGGQARAEGERTEELLEPNTWEEVTSYCNFYEFGTGKGDPSKYADRMTIEPWSVTIDGLVEKPGEYSFDQILGEMTLEERIYRFRCVEAWSMVVPWQGFELADLLNLAEVQDGAKYVAFETLYRPAEMPGTVYKVLDWPYREGLRLDEAMHPLTIMATGIFGKPLPNQNGAPLRLVVPWKYGFKSIKSVVRITLTDAEPPTSWNKANPREYGFYSNVNPDVSHPRWSQATERRIGGGLFARRRPTLMFNGYEDEVAALYEDMDLSEYF